MTVRVEPHAYPTIKGQATNESGGSGGIPISYLDLTNLAVSFKLPAEDNGTQYKIQKANSIYSGYKIGISGIEIVDITGLSVIEEFNVSEIKVVGGHNDYKYVAIKNTQKYAYPVGTTPNREIEKMGYDSITEQFQTNPPQEMSPGDYAAYNKDSIEITGSLMFSIKVVNAMGTVLQQKTVTVDPVMGAN